MSLAFAVPQAGMAGVCCCPPCGLVGAAAVPRGGYGCRLLAVPQGGYGLRLLAVPQGRYGWWLLAVPHSVYGWQLLAVPPG